MWCDAHPLPASRLGVDATHTTGLSDALALLLAAANSKEKSCSSTRTDSANEAVGRPHRGANPSKRQKRHPFALRSLSPAQPFRWQGWWPTAFAYIQHQRLRHIRSTLHRLSAGTDALSITRACRGWFSDVWSLSATVAVWCWRSWVAISARQAEFTRTAERASVRACARLRLQAYPVHPIGRLRRCISAGSLGRSVASSQRMFRASFTHRARAHRLQHSATFRRLGSA
jgi:hypothetical protein